VRIVTDSLVGKTPFSLIEKVNFSDQALISAEDIFYLDSRGFSPQIEKFIFPAEVSFGASLSWPFEIFDFFLQ